VTEFAAWIRIAITPADYEAIAATLPLGTVAVEPERAADGSVYVWLDPGVLARLKAMRGPGESYSGVILRLSASAGGRIVPPAYRLLKSVRDRCDHEHPDRRRMDERL
jgi:hypothetical protein